MESDTNNHSTKRPGSKLWDAIRDELQSHGVNIEELADEFADIAGAKVVCVVDDLKDSVRKMADATRDQVVMVRLDEESLKELDAWVESGAVKSRSEAAALFIREGLAVRADELAQLRDALRDVEEAKDRLKRKAGEVFGESESGQT